MYKLCVVLVALVAAISAKPTLVASPVAYTAGLPLAYTAGAPLAYTAPAVAYTPLATSSQYVARNYNGVVAAPYVASPYGYASAYSAYTYPYASAAYVV